MKEECGPHNYIYNNCFSYIKGLQEDFINSVIRKEIVEGIANINRFWKYSETTISNFPAASVDIFGAKIGYEKWAIDIMEKDLSSNDIETVYEALCSLCNMAFKPERLVEMICHNIHSKLSLLLKSENTFIKVKTLICLRRIAVGSKGKQAIASDATLLKNISCVLRDSNEEVRKEAAITVHFIAENWLAIDGLNKAGFIPLLIKCLLEDENYDSIIEEHMSCLALLLEQNNESKVNAISRDAFDLTPFLLDASPVIRAKTAAVFSQLFQHPIGKIGAIKKNLVPIFVGALGDENKEVVQKNMEALMFLSIEMKGRRKIVECGGLERILEIIFQPLPYPPFLVPAVKVLTSLAELSSVRDQLRKIPHFKSIPTYQMESLSRYIEILFNTIDYSICA